MASIQIRVMEDTEPTGKAYRAQAEVMELDLLASEVRESIASLMEDTDMRESISCHRVELMLCLSPLDMMHGVYYPQLKAVLVNSIIGAFEDVNFKVSVVQHKSMAVPEYSIEVLMREVV